ncbi:MAG: hypothetical protein R8L53_06880 [Mariprofundales bacterium]
MKKISVIILLLIGVAAWGFWQQEQPVQGAQTMPSWPQVSQEVVTQVEIMRDNKIIRLYKKATEWTVSDGRNASSHQVDKLVADLCNMRPVRVVSRLADHHAMLQLGDDAPHIVLRNAQGDVLLELLIGKAATDLVGNYVRLLNHDESLAVNRALLWQVSRNEDGWLATPTPSEAAQQ